MKNNFYNYNYDELINDPIKLVSDSQIESLLKNRRIDYSYATKTIKSNNQLEIEIYPEFSRTTAKRIGIKKPSRKAQRNLNEKNARKQLERLINCNFKDNDLWITVTYSNKHLPKSYKEANRNMKNYIRRINYRRKKKSLKNAKYIFITEHNENNKIRFHHHLLIEDGLSLDELESLWKFGRKNLRRVEPDEDGLIGLAAYMSKGSKGEKRWYSSKYLKKPKIRKSYTVFPYSKIKRMIENTNNIADVMMKKYKHHKYIFDEVKLNKVNGMFYIYVRMCERRNE
jgi:hypothetical protein